MDAYPVELVAQLVPCLAVSGLVPRRGAGADGAPAHPRAALDAFPGLSEALRTALERRARLRIWAPPEAHARFRVVLLPGGAPVPPAKVRAGVRGMSDEARRALAPLAPRSPLSPLQPGGPLFPDGIMSPLWLRKHCEYIPAVYVTVHCLPESDAEAQALVRTLGEQRTALAPRNIKLVALLLCERRALDAPQLDEQLSALRRGAALDPRASLFVLSDGAQHELDAFVSNLFGALHDAAREHYAEHARHVRRNRARYPPPPSVARPVLDAAAAAGMLPPHAALLEREAWGVRAVYKLAALAELQGDIGEALTLNGEAYDQLVHACLGNTRVLAPRTRRWAEAKVLADTLSLKVAKLLLYRQDTPAAVVQMRRHTRRFAELSTGWGIGVSTYEFWHWLAKQYHAFADLVAAGTRAPAGTRALALPSHTPATDATCVHPATVRRGAAPGGAVLAPTALLAAPGAYYYLAALCTAERAARFAAARAEADAGASAPVPPTYAAESRVDHALVMRELLLSAADAWRRVRRPRHALLANVRAAQAARAAGRRADALATWERVIPALRSDAWQVPLVYALLQGAVCALEAGRRRTAVVYALEGMQSVAGVEGRGAEEGRGALLKGRDALLQRVASEGAEAGAATSDAAGNSAPAGDLPHAAGTSAPAGDPPHAAGASAPADDPLHAAALLHVRGAFATPTAEPGAQVPFQVAVQVRPGTAAAIARFPVRALHVYIRERSAPLAEVAFSTAGGPGPGGFARGEAPAPGDTSLNLGTIPADGDAAQCDAAALALHPGSWLFLQGALHLQEGHTGGTLHKLELLLGTPAGDVRLVVPVERAGAEWLLPRRGARRAAQPPAVPLPRSAEPRAVRVVRAPPAMHVGLAPHALCGERVLLDVALERAEEDAMLLLAWSDHACAAGAAFVQDGALRAFVTLPAAPRTSVTVQMPQAPGACSMLARVSSTRDDRVVLAQEEHTVQVDVPFQVRVAVQWPPQEIHPEDAAVRRGHVTTEIVYEGDAPITVVGAAVEPRANAGVKAHVPLALDAALGAWAPGDAGMLCVPLETEPLDAAQPPGGAELVLDWRRGGGAGPAGGAGERAAAADSERAAAATGAEPAADLAPAARGAGSSTRVALPPLTPLPASHVRIDVGGPSRAAVNLPLTVYLVLRNSGERPTSDVQVDIHTDDLYGLAGPRQRLIPGLVPHESRMVPLRVVPRVEGRVKLPRVYAWELVPQGSQSVVVPVPVQGDGELEVVAA